MAGTGGEVVPVEPASLAELGRAVGLLMERITAAMAAVAMPITSFSKMGAADEPNVARRTWQRRDKLWIA